MREGVYTYYLNDVLLDEILPNSVFNYLVSHVLLRADSSDVGVLSTSVLEHVPLELR